MADVVTIGLVLSLACVFPLLLNFFTSVPRDSAERPEQGDSDDREDSDSNDDWPSIIGAESDLVKEDPFRREPVQEILASERFHGALR